MGNLKNVTMLLQMDQADLYKAFGDEVAKIKHEAFLNRFENVIVTTKDVAKFHNVNEKTVLNYINDGLIFPEMKINENEHPRFRLSYALTLDFKELQKKLRAKNKNW